jgi:hypothetical protein
MAGLDFASADIGFNSAGWGWGEGSWNAMNDEAERQKQEFMKSLTTGSGIVTSGTTGGAALRYQFMHDLLEKQSYEQDDAKIMKLIVKKKVTSTAVEWTTQGTYGGPGDGFTPETGSDGAFGLTSTDDNFKRRVRNVKFLAAKRIISLQSQLVGNVAPPEQTSEESATLEIIGKANRAIYFGDSYTAQPQFDGFERQINDWVSESWTSGVTAVDQTLLYDAGGAPIDEFLLQDIAMACQSKFGRPSVLYASTFAYGDMQKLLYPKERTGLGMSGSQGQDRNRFLSHAGPLRLEWDLMLRPNRPLNVDGTGLDGQPLGASTLLGTDYTSNPFATCAGAAAGTAPFWLNFTTNTTPPGQSSGIPSAPGLPTGAGNQGNRLPVGMFYYAAALVIGGLEGSTWINGASAANSFSGASAATTSSSNNIVSMTFNNPPSPNILANCKLRIYRTAALTSAPTTLSQFQFLVETGFPASGTCTVYDNGYFIPGSDTAFLMTEKKGKGDGFFWAELLPMIRRPLPHLDLGDPVLMLAFGCPILWVQRHHLELRNIGRATF